MKRILFTIIALAFASTVHAQTTATATWTQAETPAIASAYQESLQIDAAAPVTLTATCVAAGAGSTCSAPFALTAPTVSHTYLLTVCNAGFCAATSTNGAVPGLGNFKIKVTVTVTSGDDEDDDL